MTYTAISVIGMESCVVTDRIVSQCRLQCCRMAITTYPEVMKSFLPNWRHHHPMIASTIVPILIPGVDQYGRANPRLDASLLRCTLRNPPKRDPVPGLRVPKHT